MSSGVDGVRCMLMRGGTSKGAFFVASDLPEDPHERDDLLLRIMGSPDPRQIDGVGGAHPLTTKVAVVSTSTAADVDLEYLFLQPGVGEATITDRQNCGNMLAAVGPFAVERGLVGAGEGIASVRILMRNTAEVAVASFPVSGGRPVYDGATSISGVPGTAARILLEFLNTSRSSARGLLPTGSQRDLVGSTDVTLIDNGMPVVVMTAESVGVSGYEGCAELEANPGLLERLEEIRLVAGPMMRLGDVSGTTVPKLTIVAPPRGTGAVSTRTFIPHRCHSAIGVLGAVSVAAACLLPESVAAGVARLERGTSSIILEHPSGTFETSVTMRLEPDPVVERAGIVRTARLLMDGTVYPRSY